MKSSISNFVVFDIETTGLVKEENAIIEIAAVMVNMDLETTKVYDSGIMQIYGNRKIHPDALAANGISREQIANGEDPLTQLNKFSDFLKAGKDGRNLPVLVAQNGDKFDIPFLVNMFEFFKKDLTAFVNTDFTIDTMWWARMKWKESVNYKLGTICSNMGVELVNAHRAMADTKATAEVLKKFIRGLRNDGEEVAGTAKGKKFRETFEM